VTQPAHSCRRARSGYPCRLYARSHLWAWRCQSPAATCLGGNPRAPGGMCPIRARVCGCNARPPPVREWPQPAAEPDRTPDYSPGGGYSRSMSPYHGLCSELVAANLYVLQAPTSDPLRRATAARRPSGRVSDISRTPIHCRGTLSSPWFPNLTAAKKVVLLISDSYTINANMFLMH
jgi:hypothetical protein